MKNGKVHGLGFSPGGISLGVRMPNKVSQKGGGWGEVERMGGLKPSFRRGSGQSTRTPGHNHEQRAEEKSDELLN